MQSLLKRKYIRAILIIAVICIIAIFADLLGLFEILELKTVDYRTKIVRGDKVAPYDIALILIDDPSLAALNEVVGRWPWPRYIHAELIDFLSQSGAKAIVMDIMFIENEFTPNLDKGMLNESDLRLVQSTESANNVYHAVQILSDLKDEYNRDLLNKPLPKDFIDRFSINLGNSGETAGYNNYYLPFKALYEASKGIGVVVFSPDSDGVYRSENLVFNYQNSFFPSLSLAPIIGQLGYENVTLKKNSIEIKNSESLIRIPLTKWGEYYVNMYGLYDSFSISGVILSMLQIQKGELENLPVEPEEFRDKIVFIGASAAGIEDLKNTSIGLAIPGVFLHASICGNILSRDFLRFTGPGVTLLSILALLAITVFSILYLRTVFSQVLFPLAAIVVFFISALMLFTSNIVINIIAPSFAVLSGYVTSFTYISFTEGKEKRKIKNILGQYVSPAILSTVLEKEKDSYLKAEVGTRETLTMFFSDIRNFATISEKYSVEEVVEFLNAYLSRMVNIIFTNGGTLDKFIGDAIVAFWGAPVRIEDHSYKAVITAIQMIKALETFNQENESKGLPEVKIGIGIHTGEVILGNIGSKQKLDYTVIGDNVNLGSRLEGLTKTYKCPIIISQDTYDNIRDEILCRMIDYVRVKGRDKPVTIYEVIGEAGSTDEETLKITNLTEKGFGHYCKRKFPEAIGVYEKILNINPEDFLSKLFIERCRSYQKNEPPEEWDGCYVHEYK
jgi:adenylate cyclase